MQPQDFMRRAITLAERGLFTTEPNPRVGCVIVRDGEIVGEGWHEKAGEPHAEVNALRQAGDRARGADVYVTLEPCSHFGKTPPCADALVNAGVARVIAAGVDPNPEVAGKGLKRLSDAGIQTESGLLQAQAEALNPGFLQRMRRGRPYFRIKLAMSLDGRTAMASGESVWITGEAARADVQRLRARSSAILTGVGTVVHDDPSLNVRLDPGELGLTHMNQPARVILDGSGRMPAQASLLSLPGRTVVVRPEGSGADGQPEAGDYETVDLPMDVGGRVSAPSLSNWLAGQGFNEVLVEAGATVAGWCLQQGLVDELVIYMAPHLMGDSAKGLFHLPGLDRMRDRVALQIDDIRRVGQDWRITAKVLQETP